MTLRRATRVAALGAVLVFAVQACSEGGDGPSGEASGADADPWRETALFVAEGDDTRPFENGTAVALGDLDVEIFVAPYPPLREGSIDVYVTDRATGEPVEAGTVKVTFDMYMPHGTISAEALSSGPGHSLVPYKLVMPGEWRLDLALATGADERQLGLVFRVG